MLVDHDQTVPGTIDEGTGTVTFDPGNDAQNDGVLDEAARRVLLARGTVLAVRRGTSQAMAQSPPFSVSPSEPTGPMASAADEI